MCANTILLDFSLEPSQLAGDGFSKIEKEIVAVLDSHFGSGSTEIIARKELSPLGDNLAIYSGPRASIINIRAYSNGLITVNIDYYLGDGEKPLLTLENLKDLEIYFGGRSEVGMVKSKRVKIFPPLKRGGQIDPYKTTTGMSTTRDTISTAVSQADNTFTYFQFWLQTRLIPQKIHYNDCRNLELSWGKVWNKVKAVKTLPPVRRGLPFDIYFLSSDERLMEYDVDKVVFDEHSPFQHVQILHSNTFGNMLVLDDLQNLAESDLIYTESIMCRGAEDYANKEILILGGGDGALLYELRKENPKFVTMIEIDELVMQVCKVHLRSTCGDTLDTYKGSNYEIIVGDCTDYMERFAKEGKKFDYIFADLTDIPISQTPQGEIWEFIKKILNMSFAILQPNGKYMTHGNGSSSPAALKMYEDVLTQLDVPVQFTRTHAFVPSFMEDWVFYQVNRQNT